MQNLRLERPLVCFDLETTGVDIKSDRIVQAALIRVEPDGTRLEWESLVSPEMPIPAEASAVHGIYDADVASAPTLAGVADRIHELLAGADVAGFNSIRFDLPLLVNELNRVNCPLDNAGRRHLDAMRIFHSKERRDLTAAYRFYCDADLKDAHSAMADAAATLSILDAQVARYDDLPRDVEALHGFCNERDARYVDGGRKFEWNSAGEAVFRFGKHRGRTLKDVALEFPDYLEWMVGKDFDDEVKEILKKALQGELPRKA